MTSPHMAQGIQYDVTTSPLPESVLVERDVMVEMSDGTKIGVNVFRPAAEGRFPVVMSISPYGKDAFDTIENFKHVPGSHIGHIKISDHVSFEAPDPGFWVPNGYVVVQVDTRGQGASEGATVPFGAQEQRDYAELIAWAAEQVWSNGAVGLSGVSYLAITQWLVAQHRPKGLKAIMPWEGFNDFYNHYFPGGIPEVAMWPWVMDVWIKPLHTSDQPLSELVIPAEHPLKDAEWERISPDLGSINVPALICGSFSDQGLHSRDSFVGYQAIASEHKWLWSHRKPKWHAFYGEAEQAMQKRFFDRFLKEDATAMDGVAKVRVEINESRDVFTVRGFEEWPPAETRYAAYHLSHAGLSQSSSEPGVAAYSPTQGESVHFDLTFDADTVIAGHSKLKLWVSAEGADDMDLFVGLKKLDPDGNEVFFYGFGGTNANDPVARGWLRVSHRELDAAASKDYRPVPLHRKRQPLKSGEIVPVEIEILPSATLFKAGETLRLVVQGDTIEPNAVLLKMAPNNSGRHLVHFGGDFDSQLVLPHLSRA